MVKMKMVILLLMSSVLLDGLLKQLSVVKLNCPVVHTMLPAMTSVVATHQTGEEKRKKLSTKQKG